MHSFSTLGMYLYVGKGDFAHGGSVGALISRGPSGDIGRVAGNIKIKIYLFDLFI